MVCMLSAYLFSEISNIRHISLTLRSSKEVIPSFEPGGTGTPVPPCLKIRNYRFSSAFTMKGKPQGLKISKTGMKEK